MPPHHPHRHHHHSAHHHHPAGRGPPRHRRRPPSGQVQSPGAAPTVVSARPDGAEGQDAEPRPVQQHRPAVTRYRRHGDPNPRLRNHRQRQQFREIQVSSPGAGERESAAEIREQEVCFVDPVLNQSQDRGSPHQTPVAVVTPTHVSSAPAMGDVQLEPQNTPADAEEDHDEYKAEHEEELEEVKEKEEHKEVEEDGNFQPTGGNPSCSHSERAEEAERVEEDREGVMENAEEDPTAQGSEITDLCSDTESAASLSMDGPLHSPPPLQSPTPPSSPDLHVSPLSPSSDTKCWETLIPGPCDPEDLIDGIIFAATYLGCTHLLSERTPSKSARMQQAQEAMSRVRSPDSESPSTAEVDLFMSTQRIKVLNADTQEVLMDLPLRTISYIADIGNMVVLMARGKMVRSRSAQENLDHTAEQTDLNHDDTRMYRMICHVFESEDAQLIAQSIGQSFSVAYQEFLRANGIDPEDLSQREYSDLLNTQDMYNDDLIHFSKSENCRDVYIEKQKGEILGVVIVESGWGSILPTVIIASLMHGGPAEKSGRLNIGDQIMTINGTSLVGLPLSTCQSIIKGLKSQSRIKMNIVRCPPVTMVLIRRPDLRYQLGFSVQNGIICSLMRGGIAERGGVRVGHRIIEINGQSVVATPHEKIVQILSNAMGEIHMKTMPAAMYRLLTAQEQPVYI
uniref:Amyloid beta (A4) precursor protein-binding, family A, member 1b n=1 Tax=Xiphophorus couchianus TaxID=32473 RepID=A0A3B5L547_9TELE